MSNYKLQAGFFAVLIIGVVFLSFQVLKPYLISLFLALILRIVFDPFYQKILRYTSNRETISAMLAVVGVVVFIVVPFAAIGFILFGDARDLYLVLVSSNFDEHFLERLISPLNAFIGQFFPGFSIDIIHYLKQGLSLILANIGQIFTGFVSFLFKLFLMLLALFYFFRDGAKFKNYVIFLSPLSDKYDQNILARLSGSISSVIRGSLLVSSIQGVSTAIGLLIFGVPNPFLWGAVAALCALIPPFGTMPVLVPAIIFLFWNGSIAAAIGLVIWGIVMVGTIDNLLAPSIMTRQLKVHPFLILLSVLGGLLYFGPIGFLAGPVLVTLLLTLLDIYPSLTSGSAVENK